MILQLLSTIHLLSLSNAQQCNLLTSSTSYIDTESESAINTMCARDATELSLWEQYQCEYTVNIDGWRKCWPQRRMSSCSPGELKGILFIYHGYSACPGEYNQLAPKLQDNCWDVYQILTVGHGYNYCNDTSCIAGHYNLTGLPTSRQGYIDFVQRMLNAITEEVSIIKSCESSANTAFDGDSIEVVIAGLSFGAPLTAGTVAYSGNNSIFTKQIVMSPFFGITYGGFDNLIYKCLLNAQVFTECLPMYFKAAGFEADDAGAAALSEMVIEALGEFVDVSKLDSSFETFNLMIRKVLEWIIEHRDSISNQQIAANIDATLDRTFGWGAQCRIDADQRDRGGFCNFQIKNLLAVHSFAMYVRNGLLMGHMVEVDTRMEMLMVLIERDGPTRNSLCAQYLNLYYNYAVDAMQQVSNNCMWMIDAKCKRDSFNGSVDNECGAPHATLSEPSNLGIPPFELYWEEDYHNGLMAWLNNDGTFPDNFIVTDTWDLTRDQCVHLDLSDPPKSLIADVPTMFTIGLNIAGGKLTDAAKNEVLGKIADISGVSRGILELTYATVSNVIGTEGGEDENDEYLELVMSLDPDAADTMQTLLDLDGMAEIANYTVEFVEVNGEQFYPQKDEEEETKDTGKSGRKEEEGDAVAFVFIGLIICGGIIAVIVIKCKRDRRQKAFENRPEPQPDSLPMARYTDGKTNTMAVEEESNDEQEEEEVNADEETAPQEANDDNDADD